MSNTHESIDLLMREGEVLLNQHTRLNYVLLVALSFDETRITEIRFILCRRLQNDALLEKQRKFQQYSCEKTAKHKLTEKDKFGEKRIDYRSSGAVTGRDLEEFYHLEVVSDVTVHRNNIHRLLYKLMKLSYS